MNSITPHLNFQAKPLDVPSAIQKRRSIKTFKSDPIPPQLLRQLVELTVAAPSSFNLQDWRIVIVQQETQKAALAKAAWGQKQILQAPSLSYLQQMRSLQKKISPQFTNKVCKTALGQKLQSITSKPPYPNIKLV